MDYVICPICGTLVSENLKSCPCCECSSEIIFRRTVNSQSIQTKKQQFKNCDATGIEQKNNQKLTLSNDGVESHVTLTESEKGKTILESVGNYESESNIAAANNIQVQKFPVTTSKSNYKKLIRVIISCSALILIALGILISVLLKRDKHSSSSGLSQYQATQSSTTKPSTSQTNNYYDLEDSDFESEGDDNLGIHSYIWEYKKMEVSEASHYTKKELEIIRNSIFAHHGYRFKRKDLFDYFSQFAWYNPTTDNMAAVSKELSSVERYNVEFIQKQEKK